MGPAVEIAVRRLLVHLPTDPRYTGIKWGSHGASPVQLKDKAIKCSNCFCYRLTSVWCWFWDQVCLIWVKNDWDRNFLKWGQLLLNHPVHPPQLKLDNNKHIGEQKDVSGCISRAVITTKGGLAPAYKYIDQLREKRYLVKFHASKFAK